MLHRNHGQSFIARGLTLAPIVALAAGLALSGCATSGDVDGRLDQIDQRLSSMSSQLDSLDDRVRAAEAKAEDAARRAANAETSARSAANRADQAGQKAAAAFEKTVRK